MISREERQPELPPRHAKVRRWGEAARRQKEELRGEVARQRDIAREARRVLDEARQTSNGGALNRLDDLLALIDAEETAPPATDKFIFVSGCPRSGTSAMVRLLNRDPRIALGMERFKYLKGRLERRHFRREYFLNPTPDETNVLAPKFYRRLRRKFDSGTAVVYVGDKVLPHGDSSIYEGLAREFADCRFLYMFRQLEGVANSFNRRAANPNDTNWPAKNDYRLAVEVWNESLAALQRFLGTEAGQRTLVVSYEQVFSGDVDYLRAIYDFLDLEILPATESAFADATRDWEERSARAGQLDGQIRAYLDEHKDDELERMAAGKSILAAD